MKLHARNWPQATRSTWLWLPVLLPIRVASIRSTSDAVALSSAPEQRLRETVAQTCIYHHELELACDSGRAIRIVSAFWNRREPKDCKRPDTYKGVKLHCHANGTDQVIAKCDGLEYCVLPQGYTGCAENPFTWIRVRYLCPTAAKQQEPEAVGLKDFDFSKEGFDWLLQRQNLTPAPKMPEGFDWLLVRQNLTLENTDLGKGGGSVTEVMPLNLTSAHCIRLTAQMGAFNCDKKTKVGGHTSSPVLQGDNQCRCSFVGVEAMTCSRLFPVPGKTVYHAKYTLSKDAVFGAEGCDCYPTGDAMWSICDLAVREELV